MKIIDAHLHLFPGENTRAEELAQRAGCSNSVDYLRQTYQSLQIAHGIVMGNGSLSPEQQNYPADLFHYCVGLDSSLFRDGAAQAGEISEQIEVHLRRENCCGVKLYPGYNKTPLSDPLYQPIYRLAARYDKPVAVHMGLTANAAAHLKYCHPLALDEVAADHSRTRFVMCHFGSPFFESSAAVLSKNPNVSADLSGMLESPTDLDQFFREQAGYTFLLTTWLTAVRDWDRLMFGTDWPIIHPETYIRFVQRLIPESHWEQVFFENANHIYGLAL